MQQIPFIPWMRGNRALDMVRNANGPRQSSAPLTYYGAMLRVHEELSGELWSAEAWIDVARSHLMRGNLFKAELALTQAGLIRTPDPDAALLMAEVFLATGRAERADGILTSLLEQRADIARAHYLLGLASRDLGLDGEADAYRAAVAIDPDHAQAWYRLGNCLSLARESAEAMSAWREAMRVEPDHTGALYNLGSALYREGDGEGAAECLSRLRELDPGAAALLELNMQPSKPTPAGAHLRPYPRPASPKGK
ncbi:tetratricopeptide repeat protein [Gemmatimonadota bacterium]